MKKEIFKCLIIILLLVPLTGCGQIGTVEGPTTPIVAPNPDAPVTLTVTASELIIANNSSAPIYYQVFPTELLALIDWAACSPAEVCKDIEVAPLAEVRLPLDGITDKDSSSITLFWWYLGDDPAFPALQLQSIEAIFR